MRPSISLLTLVMAPLIHAIPIPSTKSVPSNSQDSSISIAPPSTPSPTIAKINSSPSMPPPGTLFVEPPPLFDPPEPRPNPLFDHPSSPSEEEFLRSPPLPESRTETLLPYDGAHVHPENTPYPPDSRTIPGTCAYSWHCSWARTTAEITGTLLLLGLVAYIGLWTCQAIFKLIMKRATLRTRSPSGSLRMEPEIGSKSASSSDDEKEVQGTNKLLAAWRTGNGEKKVTFAV